MIFQFIVGYLADRYNEVIMIYFGVVLFGIMLILISQTSSFTVLMIILLIAGLSNAVWNVAALALMGDIAEKHEGEMIGTYLSIAKIGELTSFIVGGFLADMLGIPLFILCIGVFALVGAAASSFFLGVKQ